MYLFQEKTGEIEHTSRGRRPDGPAIRDTYVKIGRHLTGILYEPEKLMEKSRIAVVVVHSDDDYSTRPIGGELAKRGFRVFCGAVSDKNDILDRKLLDIQNIIRFLKALPGVEKVVLMGHSGGATLMTAYQAAAENGVSVFQGDHMLISCSLKEALIPADGLMLLDSNWGNGAMTLFSLDPAVMEEGNGRFLDPAYDIFSETNGYSPEGACYTEGFKRQFFEAQRERNNRLIRHARERLYALERGRGYFSDDEPLFLAGAAQIAPDNKLFPQDLHLFSHTAGCYELLRGNGTSVTERIRSLRKPKGKKNPTASLGMGGLMTTVRGFLSGKAVLADQTYGIYEDRAEGILWDLSYDCPPGNVKHIHVPLLCMGMTAGYEYLASEVIYQNAASSDKTVAFVEGAGHNFQAEKECEEWQGQFGDTEKTLYDFLEQWMARTGRF